MRRIRNKFGKIDLQFICSLQKEVDELNNLMEDIFLTLTTDGYTCLKRDNNFSGLLLRKARDIKKENEELKQIINQQK